MSAIKGAALVIGGWLFLQEGAKAVKEYQWAGMDERSEAVDVLARTIWGEARGEGATGMQAVANVVVNRANIGGWWGGDIVSVCLRPWQFSCWNVNDSNRLRLLTVDETNTAFASAVHIAGQAVEGQLPDLTGGATHYHTVSILPSWSSAGTLTAQIGAHKFYTGVG